MTKPRVRLTPAHRKAEILAAGVILAEKSHYKSLTYTNVANAAGCSRALVKHYFARPTTLQNSVMRAAIKTRSVAVVAQGVADGSARKFGAPDDLVKAAFEWATSSGSR